MQQKAERDVDADGCRQEQSHKMLTMAAVMSQGLQWGKESQK